MARDLALAPNSELAVLGSCLFSAEGLDSVFEILQPADFYTRENQTIAAALLELREAGGYRPDCVCLHDLLLNRNQLDGDRGIGGVTYLGQLINASYSDAPDFIRAHAFLVAEASAKRQLAHLALQISEGCATREVEETAGLISHRLEQIQRRVVPQGAVSIQTLVREAVAGIEARRLAKQEITGVASGLPGLDFLTGGFQPSDLILLAARPSVGKTALALQIAVNACRNGARVVIFSLEMNRGQLALRMLANVTGVHLSRLRSGQLMEFDLEPFARGQVEVERFGIHVDDRHGITVAEMRASARRVRGNQPIDLIIVDYLQMAKGTNDENRNQEVASISRDLKGMAKELAVPVLALSQFNRDAERNEGHRPKLSNLRDSGALEQDADLVMFLHRENIQDRMDRKAELIIAKHRNGPTGIIELDFDGPRQRFRDVNGAPAVEAEHEPEEVV